MTTNIAYQTSLLAYKSNRAETLATEVLGYVLSRSDAARSELQEILKSGGVDVGPIARTEVIGKKMDSAYRTDLSAYSDVGEERVLIKAKFWADLTDNQPNTYLERLLKTRNPSALLFVAPASRQETLWPELLRLAEAGGFSLTAVPSAGLMSAAVNGSPHRLMLTNWLTLLGKLSRATGDPEKGIRQLQALCDQLERAAFQPLRVGEMGPDFSKRAVDLHYLYNDVIKRLREKKIAGFKGLAAAKFGPNYGRFVHLGDDSKGGIADGAWVGVNYEWGAKHKETPFWVMLGYGYRDPKIDQIRERLDSSAQLGSLLTDVQWGGLDGIHTEHNKRPVSLVPIYLPADVEYNYVLDIVIGQIQRIGDTLATPYPPQSSFRDSPP